MTYMFHILREYVHNVVKHRNMTNTLRMTQENDQEDHEDHHGALQGGGVIPYQYHHHTPPVDVEERDPEGATPLHVALSHKRLEAARMLLEAGASTGKRLEGSTPAHIALSVASIRRHRDFADA